MTLLPSTLAVVEVLESVPADDLVVAALRRLKQVGYLVALDDFTLNDPREPLTEFADIIKVDIRQTTSEQYAVMITKYGSWLRHMLTESGNSRRIYGGKEGWFYLLSGILLSSTGGSPGERNSRQPVELSALAECSLPAGTQSP